MEWLGSLTKWLKEQLLALWEAIETFFSDLLVDALELGTELVLWVLSVLPSLDFLVTYSLCNLLNAAGPDVAFFLQTFRIAEALGLIGLGYVFRLTRKLLTLGQW